MSDIAQDVKLYAPRTISVRIMILISQFVRVCWLFTSFSLVIIHIKDRTVLYFKKFNIYLSVYSRGEKEKSWHLMKPKWWDT